MKEMRVTSYELRILEAEVRKQTRSHELHSVHSHRREVESCHLKIQKSIVYCLSVFCLEILMS